MINKVTGYKLIDGETGEIYDAEIRLHKTIGEIWMKVYQVAMESLLQRKLKGSSLTVMNLLLAKAKYQNQIPTQVKLAVLAGMTTAQISRAYKELTQAGFLYKKEGVYTIDPRVAWKGTDKDRDKAIKEMFEAQIGNLR